MTEQVITETRYAPSTFPAPAAATPVLRDVAGPAPIMPKMPDPHLPEKIDQKTNPAPANPAPVAPQPDPQPQPPAPAPATGQNPSNTGVPTPTLAQLGLGAPGQPAPPAQGGVEDLTAVLAAGKPAPGQTLTLPSGNTTITTGANNTTIIGTTDPATGHNKTQVLDQNGLVIATAESDIVLGTGGLSRDTTITSIGGAITQVRSVDDGYGNITTWTANPDGSYSVRYPDGTHDATPGHAKTYTIPVGLNPAGPAPIESDITADGQQVHTTSQNSDGSVSTVASILNPDGSVDTTYPDGRGGTYTTNSRFDEHGHVEQALTGQHNPDGTGYQIEYNGIRIDRGPGGSVLVTGTQDGTSYEKGFDSGGRPFEVTTDLLHGYSLKTWTDEFGRPHHVLTDMVAKTITTSIAHGGDEGANRPWTDVTVTDLQGKPIAHYSKGGDGGVRTDDGFIHFEVEGQDVKYNSDGTVYVPDDHSTAWQRFIGTDPQPKVYFDSHGNPQLTHSGPFVPESLIQIHPPGNVPGEAFYKTLDGTLIIKDKNGYHWGVPYDGPQILQGGPPIRPPGIGPSVPGEGVPPSRQGPGMNLPGRGLGAVEGELPGLAGQFRAAPAAAAQVAEANLTRVTSASSTSEAATAARARATTPVQEELTPATRGAAAAGNSAESAIDAASRGGRAADGASPVTTGAQAEVQARVEVGVSRPAGEATAPAPTQSAARRSANGASAAETDSTGPVASDRAHTQPWQPQKTPPQLPPGRARLSIEQVRKIRNPQARGAAGEENTRQRYGGQPERRYPVPKGSGDPNFPIEADTTRNVDVPVYLTPIDTLAIEVKTYGMWRRIQIKPGQWVSQRKEVPLSKFIEKQVAKDVARRVIDPGYRPLWEFLGAGPSPELRAELIRANITIVEHL
ncbi:hypothetical protein [Nocardia sp. NPDC051981]|uniref:hypothetical protein n=1 Tax=Nocardia sp. NPDC051981 TaxID=3155417 RepID=UPI00341920E4